jgi:hypothetical protein
MDFLAFQVKAAVMKNYKHDRLFGRGEEYGNYVLAQAIQIVKETGKLSIASVVKLLSLL